MSQSTTVDKKYATVPLTETGEEQRRRLASEAETKTAEPATFEDDSSAALGLTHSHAGAEYDAELDGKSPADIAKIIDAREREQERGARGMGDSTANLMRPAMGKSASGGGGGNKTLLKRAKGETVQVQLMGAKPRGGGGGSKGPKPKKKSKPLCRNCHLETCTCGVDPSEDAREPFGKAKTLLLNSETRAFLKGSDGVKARDLLEFFIAVYPVIPSFRGHIWDLHNELRWLDDDKLHERGRPPKIGSTASSGRVAKAWQERIRPSVLSKLETFGVTIEFKKPLGPSDRTRDERLTISDIVHIARDAFRANRNAMVNLNPTVERKPLQRLQIEFPDFTTKIELKLVEDWIKQNPELAHTG